MITIRLLPPLSRVVGAKVLQLEAGGNTVAEVLAVVAQQHPAFREAFFEEDGQPSSYYVCRLNGEHLSGASSWDAQLADGDELVILAPISGGELPRLR